MKHQPLSPPALFISVPSRRNRHDGWTPARQELFIIYLEQLGVVSAAAKAVGMSPKSAYALLNRSETLQQPGKDETPTFAEAWHNAVETGRDTAFSLTIKRTVDGEARPFYYRGRQVGERRIYDNRLLLSAMRLLPRREQNGDPAATLSAFLNGNDI